MTTTATNAGAFEETPPLRSLQLDIVTTALALDRKVVQGLFMALRTAIPQDVQKSLLVSCTEELQYLIARHPRLGAFHHRRRESLRHPALAMATRKYYRECRRRRLEMALQQIASVEQHPSQSTSSLSGHIPIASRLVQRDAMVVDRLYSAYTQQRGGSYNDQDSQADHPTPDTGGSSGDFGVIPTSPGFSTVNGEAENDTSFTRMVASLSGYAVDYSTVTVGGSNGILQRRTPPLKSPRSISVEGLSCFSDALSGCSLSRISVSITGADGAENSNGSRVKGGNINSSSASAPGGQGFFARRIAHNHNGAVSHDGGSGGDFDGKTLPGWTVEMTRLLQRRMEEEQEAGTGNDPFLFISPRPIEHLLCCYGSVSRDPATLVRAAASVGLDYEKVNMKEMDQFSDAIVDEEMRWDQLAGFYRQLLRAACGPCRAAASVVANDRLVNDVIRRFWDRLTVSSEAQNAHKTREAYKSRAAAEAEMEAADVAQSRQSSGEVDEDDLNEIVDSSKDEDGAEVKNTEDGSGSGHKKAVSGSRSSKQKNQRRRSRTSKAPPKAKKKQARGADSSDVAAGGGGTFEECSNVAYYMTPLQYVYLHTRVAHVLLPDCEAVEVELLPYIQEDLLVDAAYDERDSEQTFYFGEAPRLVGDKQRPSRSSITSTNVGSSSKTSHPDKRRGSGSNDVVWDDSMGAGDGVAGKVAVALQRRFLEVRRNGYTPAGASGGSTKHRSGMSDVGLGDDRASIGPTSSIAVSVGDKSSILGDSATIKGMFNSYTDSLVLTSFTVEQLPWLTYPQFWCSMMELADNWTCFAGNPVETAVFLWELYTEVFGHSWSEEDKSLATAIEKRVAKSTLSEAEKAELAQAEQDAILSFEALLVEIKVRGPDMPSERSSVSGTSNILTSQEEGAPRRHKSKTNRDLGIASKLASPTETDDDESLLLAQESSELSLSEWKRLVEAKKKGLDKWVYAERFGDDGEVCRYRRKAHQIGRKSVAKSSSPQEGYFDTYIIEEELDENGAVVKRQMVHCNIVLPSESSESENDSFLYVDDEKAPEFRRRKYFEDKPKKFRRLELRHRVTPRYGRSDSPSSSLTSWSSIDDGRGYGDDSHSDMDMGSDMDSDGGRGGLRRHYGGRRRRRCRREKGPRGSRLVYSKEDESYQRWKTKMEDLWESSLGDNAVEESDLVSHEHTSNELPLSEEEQKHLQERKEWLCSLLKEKNIILPSQMSDDPTQERVLYNLLQLAERSEETGEDLFHLMSNESGDGGSLSALAKLLAQLKTLSLDELADTALMRRLLGEGEGGGAGSQQLSQEQMQGLLAALLERQKKDADREKGSGADPESMRDRRLRLMRMLEERRALQSAKRDSTEVQETEETFGLTEVLPALFPPLSPKRPKDYVDSPELPRYIASRPQSGLPQRSASASASLTGFSCHSLQVPARKQGTPAASSTTSTVQLTTDSILWKISPSSLEERRELERLFRELEAYWADRLSHSGRFRVDIVDYTPEQLEEFFAHLHLAPRQRALLRGRAPLASGSSLVGGTMHQDGSHVALDGIGALTARQQHLYVASRKFGPSSVTSPPPLSPAPVKLFTLTTKDSLDEALSSSYQSYLQDKAFAEALHGNIRLEMSKPISKPVPTRSPKTTPLPFLRLRESLSKAVKNRLGSTSGDSASPPPLPPSKPATSPSLPKL